MDQEAYEKGHHENIIVCFLLFPGEMVACMKFISSNINDSLFTVSQTDSIEECSYRGFQTRYIKRRNLYIFFQILGWKSAKKQHENIIRFTILVTWKNIFLEIRI